MSGQVRTDAVTLKHIQTVRRAGRIYRYLRVPGQPRIKLPDVAPDDPAFLAAYVEGLRAAPKAVRAPSGTISAAIESAMRSAAYLELSAGYRAILRRHLEAIREQAEDAMMRHLRTDDIQADLVPLTPVQARDRMKAWRFLCGQSLGKTIRTDPSEGVRRPDAPKLKGHEPWTIDHIEAFRARWPIGTVARAAMELLYWTGARRSDAVMLGRGMVDKAGVLTFRQAKTGEEAYIPWTCALPDHAIEGEADRGMMHEAIIAISTGHMTFLATKQGTRSSNAIGNLISGAAEKSGFDRSAHGLRKSRAIWLAEHGASAHQIGAWTGHQSLAEITHYIKRADRRKAVMGTDPKRLAVNSENPAVKSTASS
ncbi:hypothetical protein CDV50_11325 [Haematobacter massiliensis]|uniref:Uncharacterized protein n=2 Tax=Paracoccaceae TaxID=31989 RepID=A0A086Y838_9RHOB|nr:hypothetical protein CN97_12850 [Haematobacter massiliensis]OWJ70918.1 hypothetical protein CDV50_11325 [Haematobacter massiliensis]OWJ87459.1 hypothetical protein CDV51_06945 [Haematobacter massiliensis]QBJ24912.1 site-specific integrase [Haematobacter massiliensis]